MTAPVEKEKFGRAKTALETARTNLARCKAEVGEEALTGEEEEED